MTAKLLIRTSAILIFVHLLGHGFGHFSWDKPEDPKMAEVVTSMKGYSTEFMGATKSMADYYNGYSLIMFGLFAMTIILLWILSNHTTESNKIIGPQLLLAGLTYLFFGTIEFLYFFPFAAAISALAGILMLLSIKQLK